MSRLLLSLLFLALPFSAPAQAKFAYFSYDRALRALPGYAVAQKNLATLQAQYDAEMKRAEDEFNKKYEDFLDVQAELAPTILQKRQSELQEIMSRNLAFKEEARRLLAQAEADAYAPLHQQLADTLRKIGQERGYAFILNTDNNACPYIDPEQGDDISPLIAEY